MVAPFQKEIAQIIPVYQKRIYRYGVKLTLSYSVENTDTCGGAVIQWRHDVRHILVTEVDCPVAVCLSDPFALVNYCWFR